MNALVNQASFGQLPAAFAGMASAPGMNDEFGGGIVLGFPVLSIRGKTWHVKERGEERLLTQPNGDPMFSLEVVLVKATANLTKVYYPNGYTDGANEKPSCWSSDGLRPDAAVEQKVSNACATCPMNQFGSKITDAGKQAKACSDSKRVAIVPAGNFDMFGGPVLLRIPAATLGAFKDYAERMSRNGFPVPAIVTKVAFDPQEAYPKLTFKEVRPLSEAEAAEIVALRSDPRVARILSEATEIPAAAPEQQAGGVSWEQPGAAAPAPTVSQQATAAVQTPPQAAQTSPQAAAAVAEAQELVRQQNAAKAAAEAAAKRAAEDAARQAAQETAEAQARAKMEAEIRARVEAEMRAAMGAAAPAATVAATEAAKPAVEDAVIVSETPAPGTAAAAVAAPADFDNLLDGLLG
ncbi:hypothetical protein [Methylobacterium sp. 285MFTsu5.1]|uniref:hypothetical protein n=1 Tax=Methylobacterium sp. 285MFTsu5.1 TaxID=1172187 RepID=UPI000686CA7B|nr:hypothetical protein [Methylobacterium sp. 285MFTsu5.1]